WSYGSENTLGGSFSTFPRYVHEEVGGGASFDIWRPAGYAHPSVYKNNSTITAISDAGQGVYPPGTLFVFPGEDFNPDQYGIVRLTMPAGASGEYYLIATVDSYLHGPSSGDSDFHILKNGVEIFG